MPVNFLVEFGSAGILFIHADINPVESADNVHQVVQSRNFPLSIWYDTIAEATWAKSALRATSFALPLALDSLGISAAARIPMITITISISIRVKPFLFFLENMELRKMIKKRYSLLSWRYEIVVQFQYLVWGNMGVIWEEIFAVFGLFLFILFCFYGNKPPSPLTGGYMEFLSSYFFIYFNRSLYTLSGFLITSLFQYLMTDIHCDNKEYVLSLSYSLFFLWISPSISIANQSLAQ